jgi:hypothetical protein
VAPNEEMLVPYYFWIANCQKILEIKGLMIQITIFLPLALNTSHLFGWV